MKEIANYELGIKNWERQSHVSRNLSSASPCLHGEFLLSQLRGEDAASTGGAKLAEGGFSYPPRVADRNVRAPVQFVSFQALLIPSR